MFVHLFRNALCVAIILLTSLNSAVATTGGIIISGTRIIYPALKKQVNISVRNTSDESSYLVQSWVEQEKGGKSQDFIVTPPLYVSEPGNENTLRLMYVGLPARTDRESLYYFSSKAIPAVDKEEIEGKNTLMMAAVTRIKLFIRPDGLTPSVEKAPAELRFHRIASQVRISNPTPYYLTLVEMNMAGKALPDTMVAPRDSVLLPLPAGAGNTIIFRTINDFGSVTPESRVNLQ